MLAFMKRTLLALMYLFSLCPAGYLRALCFSVFAVFTSADHVCPQCKLTLLLLCMFCLSCTEKGGWTGPASTEWPTASQTAKEAAPGASEGLSHALICSIARCLYFVSPSCSPPCRPTALPPPSRPRRLKTMPPTTWWGSLYCHHAWTHGFLHQTHYFFINYPIFI